jgi:hypothetical protein
MTVITRASVPVPTHGDIGLWSTHVLALRWGFQNFGDKQIFSGVSQSSNLGCQIALGNGARGCHYLGAGARVR